MITKIYAYQHALRTTKKKEERTLFFLPTRIFIFSCTLSLGAESARTAARGGIVFLGTNLLLLSFSLAPHTRAHATIPSSCIEAHAAAPAALNSKSRIAFRTRSQSKFPVRKIYAGEVRGSALYGLGKYKERVFVYPFENASMK